MLEVTDFYEMRSEDDLSFDRLSDMNPNRATLRAITSIADVDAMNRDPARVFNGWATIRVQDFRFTGWEAKLTATPTKREDGTIENYWHAEVSRDRVRERMYAYMFAVTLRDTFELRGGHQSPVR